MHAHLMRTHLSLSTHTYIHTYSHTHEEIRIIMMYAYVLYIHVHRCVHVHMWVCRHLCTYDQPVALVSMHVAVHRLEFGTFNISLRDYHLPDHRPCRRRGWPDGRPGFGSLTNRQQPPRHLAPLPPRRADIDVQIWISLLMDPTPPSSFRKFLRPEGSDEAPDQLVLIRMPAESTKCPVLTF